MPAIETKEAVSLVVVVGIGSIGRPLVVHWLDNARCSIIDEGLHDFRGRHHRRRCRRRSRVGSIHDFRRHFRGRRRGFGNMVVNNFHFFFGLSKVLRTK